MLRWTICPIVLLLAGVGTAAAWADGEERRGDDDRIARLGSAQKKMSALLVKGQKLEDAGDLAAALKCYEAALTAYDTVMRAGGRDPRSLPTVAARRLGATKHTVAAVANALRWLARHQDAIFNAVGYPLVRFPLPAEGDFRLSSWFTGPWTYRL